MNNPSPSPKYALYPGCILSKSDWQRHFISARQLADCYRVPMSQCVVVEKWPNGFSEEFLDTLIKLKPRHDGNYSLPPK